MAWFPEEQKQPKEEVKAEKLIEDEDELIMQFNDLVSKIQLRTDEAYNMIYPIVYELMGEVDSPTNTGEMGKLKGLLRDSPLMQTSTGQLMWEILKKFETLKAWQSRYSKDMEQFTRDMNFLCRSAFVVIKKKKEEKDELNVRIKRMEQGMMVPLPPGSAREPQFPMSPPPATIKIVKVSEKLEPILTENRMIELEEIYKNCNNAFAFANMVNPKRGGKNLTESERQYLKSINTRVGKFRKGGEYATQPPTPPSEKTIFSPVKQENPPNTRNSAADEADNT